jgi:hypothetical protein
MYQLQLKEFIEQSANRLLKAQTLSELALFFEELHAISDLPIRKNAEEKLEKEKKRPLKPEEKENIVISTDEIADVLLDDLTDLFKQLNKNQLEQLTHRVIISYKYYHGRQDQLDWTLPKTEENSEKSKIQNDLKKCKDALRMTQFFMTELSQHGDQDKLIAEIEPDYQMFEEKSKEATETNSLGSFSQLKIEDIMRFSNDFIRARFIFNKELLPKVKNSGLLRYIEDPGEIIRKDKDGTSIVALQPRLDAIQNDRTLSRNEKLEHLKQAFLDVYYAVRQDQGWFDNSLGDALEKFLVSPNGLNLRHDYGPLVVPHQIKSHEKPAQLAHIKKNQEQFANAILDHFKAQNKFNDFMKKNRLGFMPDEVINLENMDNHQRSRVRYMIYNHALQLMHSPNKIEREQGKSLLSLFSKSLVEKDKIDHPFSIACQKLIDKLNGLPYKKYQYSIESFKESLETIRNDYPNDEKKAYQAMKKLVVLKCSQLKENKEDQKGLLSLFRSNNLCNTLEKFAKQEFKVNQIKKFTGELPTILNKK